MIEVYDWHLDESHINISVLFDYKIDRVRTIILCFKDKQI